MGDTLWYLRTIYRPRDAAKHFLVIQPKMETLFGIVALYGGLTFLEGLLSGEKPPGLMPMYFVIGWLGSSGGVFLVGRLLRGKATMASCLGAVGISFVVPLVVMPVSFPLNFLASLQTPESMTLLGLGVLVVELATALW